MTDSRSGARLRANAARVVEEVVSGGRSLDDALGEARTPPADRPLLRLLSSGAIRRHYRLREYIDRLLQRPLKKRDGIVASLLAVGLYQLTETRVPQHAAVSLTVDAARLLRRPKHAPLVNALLRNFLRSDLASVSPRDDESRYNHPQWLIDALRSDWPEHWQEILEANDRRAPMWLRVNRRHSTPEAYLERLPDAPAEGPGHTLLPGFDSAVRLASPLPVEELPGFADGQVSVQDAAAQLAAPWLLSDGGSNVLDACAAPGGKTGHLLELAHPDTALTAIDNERDRLERVKENLVRLRGSATVIEADASIPQAWWNGRPFDRILLDAPCSATGVIRRHPDIKILRRGSDVAALAERQRRMLKALWSVLAPGGRLLYVTCSVLDAENSGVVEEFLRKQDGASERDVLPDYNIRDLMYRRSRGYQTLPGEQDLDGFYFACLEKSAKSN